MSRSSITNGRSKSAIMSSRPSFIVYPETVKQSNANNIPQLRFLIMDAPSQQNLHLYIKECKRYGVTDIVRVCEPTYSNTSELANAGIALHDMAYDDGTSPPDHVLDAWLDIVERCFININEDDANDLPTVAVHCIAGLGRAPVLVTIALMEYCKCDAVVAVTLIRKLRRGAINQRQLTYLEHYKCRRAYGSSSMCCIIS